MLSRPRWHHPCFCSTPLSRNPSSWKGAHMRRSASIVVSLLTTVPLALGASVVSAPAAQAAAPKSCSIKATENWWIIPQYVGTPLYHLVVTEKVVNEGGAAYFCVWVAMDRRPPGKHEIDIVVSKPGPNIHVETTTAWRLVTPKPFKIYAGQKFTVTARVTTAAPHQKDNKHTVKRKLTVNLKSGGVVI